MSDNSPTKDKKLDLLVIILGSLSLIAALLFGYILKDSPNNAILSNIAFTVGFLAYIVYSYLKSSSYEKQKFQLETTLNERNQEIQDLNGQLEKAKKEIGSLNNEVSKLKSDLKKSKEAEQSLKSELEEAQKQIAELNKEENS